MAKKEETKSVATQEPAGALARPSHIPTSREGLEHIRRQDLKISRILVAQQMSPQVNANEPSYIDGLKVGDMFNDLTGRIYGKGPLDVVILRGDDPRYIEFFPRESGGGIKDANINEDDPRAQFSNGPDGKRVPPIATKFYDYVVATLPLEPNMENYLALSFKGAALKAAMTLNALLKQRAAPIYSTRFQLTSLQMKNSKGVFSVIWARDVDWLDEGQFAAAKILSDSVREKNVDFQREPGSDDVEPLATDM